MTVWDVVVVGAGPAGSMAAGEIAAEGFSVLLVEKDRTIGSPVRCAEAVGEDGLREFFKPDDSWISAQIKRFILTAPDGTDVEIIPPEKGYILDRARFDLMIALEAIKKGATVLTGQYAHSLENHCLNHRDLCLRGDGGDTTIRTRIVIGADGVESLVGRWVKLSTRCRSHDMEVCVQDILANIQIDDNCCHMIYGRNIAPGGYAWIFPKGNDVANVGLGISGDYGGEKTARQYLDEFIDRRFNGASVIYRTAGGVPCSGGVREMVADGVLITGDAAHMANPLTGGGIINALKGGKLAGHVAAECLRNGDVSRSALKRYEKQWNNYLGRMHRRYYKIKEWVSTIDDTTLNRAAHELNKLPIGKRNLHKILEVTLKKNPRLLLEAAKLVF